MMLKRCWQRSRRDTRPASSSSRSRGWLYVCMTSCSCAHLRPAHQIAGRLRACAGSNNGTRSSLPGNMYSRSCPGGAVAVL
jgi:hypothetical protein